MICGGESQQGKGHEPRPYDLAWPRSIIRQCREAGAAAFVKQLGYCPTGDWLRDEPNPPSIAYHTDRGDTVRWLLKDKAGADPSEWPDDLRVQETPEPAGAIA